MSKAGDLDLQSSEKRDDVKLLDVHSGEIAEFVRIAFRRARDGDLLKFLAASPGGVAPFEIHRVVASVGTSGNLDAAVRRACAVARFAAEIDIDASVPLCAFRRDSRGAGGRDAVAGFGLGIELDDAPTAWLDNLTRKLGAPALVLEGGGHVWDFESERHPRLFSVWRLCSPARDECELELLRRCRFKALKFVHGDTRFNGVARPVPIGGLWRLKSASEHEIELGDLAARLP